MRECRSVGQGMGTAWALCANSARFVCPWRSDAPAGWRTAAAPGPANGARLALSEPPRVSHNDAEMRADYSHRGFFPVGQCWGWWFPERQPAVLRACTHFTLRTRLSTSRPFTAAHANTTIRLAHCRRAFVPPSLRGVRRLRYDAPSI
jgi:hypothetical protein